MQEKQVLERAFAMPLTSPAYPPGPYRFVNREYLIITYRTDPARLRAVVPEPLELDEREALVKYEFIRMPDSNGFGDYTESGQVIPSPSAAARAATPTACFSTTRGRSPVAASSGAFPRNWRSRHCEPRSTRLLEPWIMGRFALRPARWATNTAKLIWHKSKLRSRLQIFCSRSFRMSTARRASASSSNTISRMAR